MDERFKRITVYDLMTMQCGQESDAAFIRFLENPEDDLCAGFFRTPMDCEPGKRFYYNNAVPHLLFFLVERSTGKDIKTYMDEKLCRPLGIRIEAQYNAVGVYDPVKLNFKKSSADKTVVTGSYTPTALYCVDYFEDKLPKDLDERFKRITVYDLMTMQCGQ